MGWDEVRAFALTMPGAMVSTSYGREAVKVHNKMFVVVGRTPDHFVLTAPLGAIEMLIETEPAVFFQTPHYVGWPNVLVRHATADRERLEALIERAWEGRASRAQRAERDSQRA